MAGRLERLAYQYIGSMLENYLDRFADLRIQIEKANIRKSLRMYLSIAIFWSIVATLSSFVILLIVKFLLLRGLPFIFVPLFSMIVGLSIIIYYLVYPSYVASERKRKIDSSLPAAASYMAAMASAGVTPDKIFLSMAKQDLGLITEEASKIARDIQLFNEDVVRALDNAVKRSPSHKFANFLEGIIGVFTSGGDLQIYLETMAANLMQDKINEQRNFIESLGLVAELFLVMCVVAPVFFVVMLAMVSMQGTMEPSVILLFTAILVFVIIPMLQTMILLMVDGLQPEQ